MKEHVKYEKKYEVFEIIVGSSFGREKFIHANEDRYSKCRGPVTGYGIRRVVEDFLSQQNGSMYYDEKDIISVRKLDDKEVISGGEKYIQ